MPALSLNPLDDIQFCTIIIRFRHDCIFSEIGEQNRTYGREPMRELLEFEETLALGDPNGLHAICVIFEALFQWNGPSTNNLESSRHLF